MAFTKSPVADTYSTERLPAAYSIEARGFEASGDFSKDGGMLNLIPVKVQGPGGTTVESQTRPPFMGMVMINSVSGDPITGTFRGGYVWSPDTIDPTVRPYFFAVIDLTVWTSRNGTTWYPLITGLTGFVGTSDCLCGFSEYIYSTGLKRLILLTGRQGFVFTDDTTYTQITDVDFPAYHIPTPVVIDGYLFVAKRESGDIYNSNLDDPLSWTAGSFISAEMYPDNIKTIVKVDNYLLAIGSQSCEYFYDAANATGSPLARQEGSTLPFGCAYPKTIAHNKNTVAFLATHGDGESSLIVIEGFKAEVIPCHWLIPILEYYPQGIVAAGLAPSFQFFHGNLIRKNGQVFYVLQTGHYSLSVASTKFVYCFSTGMWVEWFSNMLITQAAADQYHNNSYFFGNLHYDSTTYYPFCAVVGAPDAYAFEGSSSPYLTQSFVKDYATDQLIKSVLGEAVFEYFSNIETEIRTPVLDFGTLNKKTNSRFGVAFLSPATLTLNLTLTYNDVDGTGASTTTIINAAAGNNFPFTVQLGQFRRRQYKISYTGNEPIRYKFFEVDINKGQQ